jgi:hypothetical protein
VIAERRRTPYLLGLLLLGPATAVHLIEYLFIDRRMARIATLPVSG